MVHKCSIITLIIIFRSLEMNATEFKLKMANDITRITNNDEKKERRKRNDRGLATQNANGSASSLNTNTTLVNDEHTLMCVAGMGHDDHELVVHGSCKSAAGTKTQHGHRQPDLASSSPKSSEEETIFTEEQLNENTVSLTPQNHLFGFVQRHIDLNLRP